MSPKFISSNSITFTNHLNKQLLLYIRLHAKFIGITICPWPLIMLNIHNNKRNYYQRHK